MKNLISHFKELYGNDDEILCFHSPGRINLIGEHTDYNGGYVFPCALNFGTYGIVRKRLDDTFNFASTNFDKKVSCKLSDMNYNENHEWANYLKGVVVEFQKSNLKVEGLDILISGNIPNGSGLSSSASIELLMAVILNNLFKNKVSRIELVKMCQRVENDYMGLKSGIMDQFAVGMGKKDYAILLDCNTLHHQYVPFKLSNHKIIISNTNKKRGLVDSEYNLRRSECEKAVELLNQKLNITYLSEITPKQFEENKYLITDEIALKRATHVVYEIERTINAVNVLNNNDLEKFGQLMNESHKSLKDLYEVSCKELDILVESALEVEGVLGSRMTGAGFGGCTISLVEKDKADDFIEKTGKLYKDKIGYEADFYIAEVGNGTKQVEL